MKKVLILASLSEGGFGLLLLASLPIVSRLLFTIEASGIGISIGRLTRICLIALAVACWPVDESRGAFYGVLTWSVLAMLYLIVVGRYDSSHFPRLNQARFGRVLSQREMGSRSVIVSKIGSKNTTQEYDAVTLR